MVLTHNHLNITEHEFRLPRLPKAWDGLRVLQLSDFHFYEYSSQTFCNNVLAEIEALKPDLIVCTGDYIHFGNQHLDKVEKFLSVLNAPLGKYGILGNHDYYDKAYGQLITETLAKSGIQLLKNNALQIQPQSLDLSESAQQFWLAGLDDLWCGTPDISKALQNIPSDAFVLMLAHNPLLFDAVSYYDKQPIDILLSGHTHGGHVYIPVLGPIYRHVLKMKYRYHFHHKPYRPHPSKNLNSWHTQLYITSGVGSAAFYVKGKKRQFGFPRFRFNTYPEIVLHTLKTTHPS